MSDKFNEIIQDIAVLHNVVLSKDDPILILHTMNERLIEENRNTQQAMLAQFKEEMENIASQWKSDAKEKAERILNAALAGSKEAMTRLLQDSTRESILVIKKMISDSLVEAHDLAKQKQKFSRLALLLSTVILTFSCLLILLFSFMY